jgi:hypothetical protein
MFGINKVTILGLPSAAMYMHLRLSAHTALPRTHDCTHAEVPDIGHAPGVCMVAASFAAAALVLAAL